MKGLADFRLCADFATPSLYAISFPLSCAGFFPVGRSVRHVRSRAVRGPLSGDWDKRIKTAAK